jgi:hypothetical protein
MDSHRCPMCGAVVPDRLGSCRALFEEVCAREYSDPAFGAVHLLTVDAYALQHSEEHGPRSNAFHLMRLCRLLERGGDPGIGQRPPRKVGKAFEGQYRALPTLEPPPHRGSLTIANVHGAQDPGGHAERVRAWARSVWEAYHPHHEWARALASSGGPAEPFFGR